MRGCVEAWMRRCVNAEVRERGKEERKLLCAAVGKRVERGTGG